MESPAEGAPPADGLKTEIAVPAAAASELTQAQSRERLVGTVKAWNEERGFGFVQVDGVEGDVYVHRTVLQDGQTLIAGARIQLETTWDPMKNKMAAISVVGAKDKGQGKGMSPESGWSNWDGAAGGAGGKGGWGDASKGKGLGWGGAGCGAVPPSAGGYGPMWEKGGYGGDPWSSAGGEWGPDYGKGGYGKDYSKGYGKDYGQGKGYGGCPCGGPGPYGKDYGKGFGKDYGKDYGMDYGSKGGGKPGCGGPSEWLHRQPAWVEYWVDYEGYGCTITEMGEHVYVSRTLTEGHALYPGQHLIVEAAWNWERNGWQATFCAPGASDGSKGKGKTSTKAGTEAPVTMGQQGGTVKAWNDNYGFIAPDNGGPDVFVHKQALQGGDGKLAVGTRVAFSIQWDEQRQKYLAQNCTDVSAGQPGGGAPPGAAGG